jgi:hypothetical protein
MTAVVLAPNAAGVVFLIESLSVGGASLVGPLAAQAGERLSVLFEIDDSPIDLAAEVVRVEQFDFGTDLVAVRFVDVPDRDVERLHVLVSRIMDLEGDDA